MHLWTLLLAFFHAIQLLETVCTHSFTIGLLLLTQALVLRPCGVFLILFFLYTLVMLLPVVYRQHGVMLDLSAICKLWA